MEQFLLLIAKFQTKTETNISELEYRIISDAK